MKQLTVILIGAGGRGTSYSRYMKSMPEKYKLIGVADPIAEKRRVIKELWNLSEEMCFESWEDILSLPKMADILVLARQGGGQTILQVVGVLVLVDEDIAELVLIVSTHILVLLQKQNSLKNDIVKIQCIILFQPRLIFLIGLSNRQKTHIVGKFNPFQHLLG